MARPAPLLDPRRLPTWVALAVAAASGVVLFAADDLLRPLGLEGFRERHRGAVGLAFLGSGAFVLLSSAVGLVSRWQRARRIARRIEALDAGEQAVLREFALQGRNTIVVLVNDPAVAGLLAEGALAQVGGMLQPTPKGLVGAVRVGPGYRRHLDPAAIGLTTWSPDAAERRRLLATRPGFVGEVARWDAVFRL